MKTCKRCDLLTLAQGILIAALLVVMATAAWFKWETESGVSDTAAVASQEAPRNSATPPPAPRREPEAPATQPDPIRLLPQGVTTVPLQSGLDHFECRHSGRWENRLSTSPPAGLRRPPPGEPLLYGVIPLAGASATPFAVSWSGRAGDAATFHVDRNRDGDFGNDQPRAVPGTGTAQTAAVLELDFLRADGSSYPYWVWLWTSLGGNPEVDPPGFKYYVKCSKSARVAPPGLEVDGGVLLRAPDPGNTGAFPAEKVHLDWNGNGGVEECEWLAPGGVCRYGGALLRLVRIHPYADAVDIECGRVWEGAADTPDVRDLLALEPLPGNRAPPLEAVDLAGNPASLDRLQGQVVMVSFWASWCGPCHQAMPEYSAVYEEFKGRGLVWLSVSLDQDIEAARDFQRQLALSGPVICDGKAWNSPLATAWRVRGVPSLFLVGRDGRIVSLDQPLKDVIARQLEPVMRVEPEEPVERVD